MLCDIKECREHAEHCLMLAAEARDLQAKRRFEALAQSWMKLGSDIEMAKVLARRSAIEGWRGATIRAIW